MRRFGMMMSAVVVAGWAGIAGAEDIDAMRAACDAREGAVCHDLAMLYLRGEGVPEDMGQVVIFLKKGCERGADDACLELGDMVRKDTGPDKRRRESTLQYFLGRCDASQALGCAEAAEFYNSAEGYEDAYLSLLYDQKACELERAESCTFTGMAFEEGRGIGVDPVQARAYYGKACAGGDGDGCGRLSEMVLAGRGGAEDKAAGETARARACELGAVSYCD